MPTVVVGQIDSLSASLPLTTPARLVCAYRHQHWICTRPAGHRGTQHVATVWDHTVVATWPRS